MRTLRPRAATFAETNGTFADDPYPQLRRLLHPNARALPAEDVERIVAARFGPEVAPEDVEGFLDNLGPMFGRAGQNIVNNLPAIASGAATGAAVGGPYGALFGAALPVLTSAIPAFTGGGQAGAGPSPARPPIAQQYTPAVTPPTAAPAASAPVSSAGAPAAGQLLQMLANPAVVQALMAALLGPAGAPKVSVNGTPTAVPAVLNAVGELASRASEELAIGLAYDERAPFASADEGIADPASDRERADAVARLFAPTPRAGEAAYDEDAEDAEDAEDYEMLEAAAYDEQDLLELYADYAAAGDD